MPPLVPPISQKHPPVEAGCRGMGIDPLYTPFLGEQGAEAGNLSPDKDLKHFRRHGLEQKLGRCFAEPPGPKRFAAFIRSPMGSHQGGALLPAEALW